MDLGAEFAIPATLSQVIEWDSAEEEDKHDTAEEQSSPIFRRCKLPESPLSPVLKSRKRSTDVSGWLPTKRKLEMECSESSMFVKTGEKNSSYLMPTLSTWLTRLSPVSSSDSCQVSSCDSIAGLAPQPSAEETDALTGASWLAGVENRFDIGGDTDTDSSSEEGEECVVFITSDKKKKKPIKHGLVAGFELLLKSEKSKRALAKYQMEQGTLLSDEIEKNMLVEFISLQQGVSLIAGGLGTLIVNNEFCPKGLAVGDTVTFPTPRVSTMVEGKEVWLGVTDITILSGRSQIQEQLAGKTVGLEEEIISLKCPCKSLSSSVCSKGAMPNLSPPASSPLPGLNIPCTSLSPLYTPEKLSTIRQVVERLGGFSSSPQQVDFRKDTRDQQVLEVVVHRVFNKVRRDEVNITLDNTLGVDEMGLSLLCEDQSGDFSIIKLHTELKNVESWSILFGSNWEVVVGSKVIITSPLYVQNRITRSNKHKLFNIIRSIRNTNQRFCYVMKAFPGSRFELVEVGVEEMPCISSLSRASRAEGCRINIKLTVIYLEEETMYVQDNSNSEQAHPYLKVTLKPSFPLPDQLSDRIPVTTLVTGLHVEYQGNMFLDYYSTMMAVTSVTLAFHTLPAFSTASKVGDLVKVEGVILRVDKDASMQWMECSVCMSENVALGNKGWSCYQCGQVTTHHKMELVCCVSGVWVVLRETARKLLQNTQGRGCFHPDDIVGTVVPTVMCKVGKDLKAVEC